MLSSVLNSERAIQVNIQIMRAFTQLRRMVLTNVGLKRKIEEMEKSTISSLRLYSKQLKNCWSRPLIKREE